MRATLAEPDPPPFGDPLDEARAIL
ncbi:MAG: hypothetical protein JWQ97_3796, partial [Phenylobacterium sp.]|nr:hypothetical protein [Phenylobacterium sp.]